MRPSAPHRLLLALLLCLGGSFSAVAAEVPENFRRDNLVAWCVVPFDAKKRNPGERAAMLQQLGLTRCAYDWRQEHVAQFGEEIEAYQQHQIEFFAFWKGHESAFSLFGQHELQPQIWHTLRSPKSAEQEAMVTQAVEVMRPIAETTREQGLQLGLYNHGGWGGEPANLVAVCKALRAAGFPDVGIVYNFHHAHTDLEDFAAKFQAMMPYLLCLNLNGMTEADASDYQKIRPIGSGTLEAGLIDTVISSGYTGPIGILGHVHERDVEVVLRENLAGLEKILEAR